MSHTEIKTGVRRPAKVSRSLLSLLTYEPLWQLALQLGGIRRTCSHTGFKIPLDASPRSHERRQACVMCHVGLATGVWGGEGAGGEQLRLTEADWETPLMDIVPNTVSLARSLSLARARARARIPTRLRTRGTCSLLGLANEMHLQRERERARAQKRERDVERKLYEERVHTEIRSRTIAVVTVVTVAHHRLLCARAPVCPSCLVAMHTLRPSVCPSLPPSLSLFLVKDQALKGQQGTGRAL